MICPKCKEKIDWLHNYQSGENHTRLSLFDFKDKKIADYELCEFQANGKINDFECPECSEVLFRDEKKAIAFLEDNDELQELVVEKLNKIKEKNDMPKV